MRNTHYRTWNMARKLKKAENETQTLFDLEYGEKTENHGKGRNTHCRMRNMARNTETGPTGKLQTIGPGVWREY
jgi:hypothetical protein